MTEFINRYVDYRTGVTECDCPGKRCAPTCESHLMSLTDMALHSVELSRISSLSYPTFVQNYNVSLLYHESDNCATVRHDNELIDCLRSLILDPFTHVLIVQDGPSYRLVFKSYLNNDVFPFYAHSNYSFGEGGSLVPCSGRWEVSFEIDRVNEKWFFGRAYQDADDYVFGVTDEVYIDISGVMSDEIRFDETDGWLPNSEHGKSVEFSVKGRAIDVFYTMMNLQHYMTGLISFVVARLNLERIIRGADTIEELFSIEFKPTDMFVQSDNGPHVVTRAFGCRDQIIRGYRISDDVTDRIVQFVENNMDRPHRAYGTIFDVYENMCLDILDHAEHDKDHCFNNSDVHYLTNRHEVMHN